MSFVWPSQTPAAHIGVSATVELLKTTPPSVTAYADATSTIFSPKSLGDVSTVDATVTLKNKTEPDAVRYVHANSTIKPLVSAVEYVTMRIIDPAQTDVPEEPPIEHVDSLWNYWDGTRHIPATPKAWNGSSWDAVVRVWDGAKWIPEPSYVEPPTDPVELADPLTVTAAGLTVLREHDFSTSLRVSNVGLNVIKQLQTLENLRVTNVGLHVLRSIEE